MLPATRMTKRSPSPWSKMISAGTRESEQPRMMAMGDWLAAATWTRRASPVPASPRRAFSAKRRLPSRRRLSASQAGIICLPDLVDLVEEGTPGNLDADPLLVQLAHQQGMVGALLPADLEHLAVLAL